MNFIAFQIAKKKMRRFSLQPVFRIRILDHVNPDPDSGISLYPKIQIQVFSKTKF